MGTATSHVPPGIRQVFRYSVTDSSPASTRTPHRGLPSTTLTLVFATDAANDRIAEARAHVEWPLHVNDLAHHREIWLRDPDDFRVILSGK